MQKTILQFRHGILELGPLAVRLTLRGDDRCRSGWLSLWIYGPQQSHQRTAQQGSVDIYIYIHSIHIHIYIYILSIYTHRSAQNINEVSYHPPQLAYKKISLDLPKKGKTSSK